MNTRTRLWTGTAKALIATCFVFLAFVSCSNDESASVSPLTGHSGQTFEKVNVSAETAEFVQAKHESEILSLPDVVGIGIGSTADRSPAIVIFTDKGANKRLPRSLEGIPVKEVVVGRICAQQAGGKFNPKDRQTRPVPIGVSTGNINRCSSGSIGCRVRRGDEYFLLSCNHVFARENYGIPGETIVQPSRLDNGCVREPNDFIGTLAAVKLIDFTMTANNTMDAAIVSVSPLAADRETPKHGYGLPSSIPAVPIVDMKVQKYGCATELTKGEIIATNVTVTVYYGSGWTRFVDQFMIQGKKPFTDAGDSGALIVTDDRDCKPVGMVFAGSLLATVANPVIPILTEFNVTVDGK